MIETNCNNRLVRLYGFLSPRGTATPTPEYVSRFGFYWWFWMPRLHRQHPDSQNPRVIRIIWLCGALNLDIWGSESRDCWPNTEQDRGVSRCSDAADFPTDAEMLDWIEEKQVNGEWISNAIHWDGRKIRDCIAAEMQEENSKS